MKKNKFSIKTNILLYLIIYSIIILSFIYIIQIGFLNISYKIEQSKILNNSITEIKQTYKEENYESLFNIISANNNICLELINNDATIYTSSTYNKKCLSSNNKALLYFEKEFISSNQNKKQIEIINPLYNNNTLIIGEKLSNNSYIFASTSLIPLDNSISILKSQFIYIAILIFIMSIVLSYFISNHIAKPIIKLNENAKQLRNKSYIDNEINSSCYEIDLLSKTIEEAKEELGKTEQLRQDLMANVSHDLKTPLTMIKAYAEAAKDLNKEDAKKQEEDLNIIIEETDRLTILVNDILELSKLENITIKEEKELISINDLIESILKRYTIIKEQGYTFIFNKDGNYNVKVNKKHLEQVIYNLINNAINYTGEDKKIIIDLTKEKKYLKLSITDTGKGISKEEINLIWDKYYRTKRQHQRNIIGTGLGLSIVKNIFEQYNIKYGVTSKEKKGTTFYFYLKIED